MSRHLDRLTWLQRHPAVRLRREAWGGFAFHRDTGDLLELDRDGFDVVLLMGTAHTFVDLCSLLRASGHQARRPRLASFLRELETHAIDRPCSCGLLVVASRSLGRRFRDHD